MRIALYTLYQQNSLGKNKKIYPKRNWNFFITNKYESLDINDKLDYEIVKKISKL